jgi:hypothetical protein
LTGPQPQSADTDAVAAVVVARAHVRASEDEVRVLRRSPSAPGGVPASPGLLKHADEQTVVGVAAVLQAAHGGGLDPAEFGRWGVVAAPCYFGLRAFRAAFPKFQAEGVWGVAPLLVASHSLHALSGVVSQALGAHGPNLGVGGAPGDEPQAFLAAATLLDDPNLDGVWVVLTGIEAETTDGPRVCEAAALALTPARLGRSGTRLRLRPGAVEVEGRWEETGLAGRETRWRLDFPSAAEPHGAGAGRVVEVRHGG